MGSVIEHHWPGARSSEQGLLYIRFGVYLYCEGGEYCCCSSSSLLRFRLPCFVENYVYTVGREDPAGAAGVLLGARALNMKKQ